MGVAAFSLSLCHAANMASGCEPGTSYAYSPRQKHHAKAQQMADFPQARTRPVTGSGSELRPGPGQAAMPSRTPRERMQRQRGRLRPHHPQRLQQHGQPAIAVERLS